MGYKNAGKLIFLFLLSYAVLFMLGAFNQITGFGGWNFSADLSRLDFFYALPPISAFFFMYFLVGWIETYFETKFTRTVWFGFSLFILSIIAYYVSLFWFYCNICSSEGANQTSQFLSQIVPIKNVLINFLTDFPIEFIGQFFNSLLSTQFVALFLSNPYIIFVLGAIFGWASRLIILRLDAAKE